MRRSCRPHCHLGELISPGALFSLLAIHLLSPPHTDTHYVRFCLWHVLSLTYFEHPRLALLPSSTTTGAHVTSVLVVPSTVPSSVLDNQMHPHVPQTWSCSESPGRGYEGEGWRWSRRAWKPKCTLFLEKPPNCFYPDREQEKYQRVGLIIYKK